jgi:thioesterase domain-containing protein/acyl carrier protein
MMTAPPVPPEQARPGTVGRVPAGEMAIRGDDGAMLPSGQTGQVVLRGPSVMPGYLLDIDGEPTGLENGWLATGDLGRIDADGFLSVVGRTKEIINRGGEKISPYDVEKALLEHPAVKEAAVFAVPHPRLGENVAAAVVLEAGESATSSALVDFLYDRLAPFQLPRQVHVLASLPVGTTGKISRPQLSAMFADQAREIVAPDQPLQIQIAEIWQRHLERDDIGIDDDFFEIGGDSLQATEMLLQLEEATGQAVAPSEVRAELTIRNLALALARSATSAESVTRIKDGSGMPLFLCHGDYDGWGLYALRLAELLDDPGPVYLLHSNLDRSAGIATIEDMAGQYLPRLVAAWPEGRFRLAGYCHGGLAAWELAHRLQGLGRQVESVILIDTFSLNARPALRAVARTVGADAMPSVWGTTRRLLQKDRAILWRAARRLYGTRSAAVEGPAARAGALRWTYYQAMSGYVPPRIDADVLCLLSDEYADRKEFAPKAWRRLARSVRVERIPGKHNTCITSHVGDLATTLGRYLAAS